MGELIPVQPNGWNHLKTLVLDGVRSPDSRRSYSTSLDNWLAWYQMIPEPRPPFFSKACVNAYRAHLEAAGLASSTINVRLAAIRKLASEAVDNNLVDPHLAAGIANVKGAAKRGARIGNWLSAELAERLIQSPDPSTMIGKRDRAILGMLIGCGLRRGETVALTMGHLQQREGRWVIVDVQGKGNRIRSVAMPGWAKALIDTWTAAAGIDDGRIFRAVNRGGRVSGEGLKPNILWKCVQKYARFVQVMNLAPHDLRRTYAKLAHSGRAPLEQIQISLGHASLITTEKYLGVRQDLADAPCDHLGLRISTEPAP